MEWDLLSKALIKEHIQDFVDYFMPGAKFVRFVESQLQTRVDSLFDPREMRADVVAEVKYRRKSYLSHYECQSTGQPRMARRMLGYGYELNRGNNKYAFPVVIYTQPIRRLPPRLLRWCVPFGPHGCPREILRYEHEALDVCNTAVEEFRLLNKDGFRPLMLLSKGGATIEVLDEVLNALREHNSMTALTVALIFASRVLKSEEEVAYLKRRRNMLDPILKDTWMYKWIWEEIDEAKVSQNRAEAREKGLKEGRNEGLKEGRNEGLKEGHEEAAKQAIEMFVEARFPDLLAWAKAQIQQMSDLATLQQVLAALFRANTVEDMRAAFAI